MPRTNTIDLTVNYYKLLGIKPQKNEAGELAYEYVTETVIREQFRTAARAGHADHAKTEADKAKAKNTDMAKLKNARDCLVEIVGSPSLKKEFDQKHLRQSYFNEDQHLHMTLASTLRTSSDIPQGEKRIVAFQPDANQVNITALLENANYSAENIIDLIKAKPELSLPFFNSEAVLARLSLQQSFELLLIAYHYLQGKPTLFSSFVGSKHYQHHRSRLNKTETSNKFIMAYVVQKDIAGPFLTSLTKTELCGLSYYSLVTLAEHTMLGVNAMIQYHAHWITPGLAFHWLNKYTSEQASILALFEQQLSQKQTIRQCLAILNNRTLDPTSKTSALIALLGFDYINLCTEISCYAGKEAIIEMTFIIAPMLIHCYFTENRFKDTERSAVNTISRAYLRTDFLSDKDDTDLTDLQKKVLHFLSENSSHKEFLSLLVWYKEKYLSPLSSKYSAEAQKTFIQTLLHMKPFEHDPDDTENLPYFLVEMLRNFGLIEPLFREHPSVLEACFQDALYANVLQQRLPTPELTEADDTDEQEATEYQHAITLDRLRKVALQTDPPTALPEWMQDEQQMALQTAYATLLRCSTKQEDAAQESISSPEFEKHYALTGYFPALLHLQANDITIYLQVIRDGFPQNLEDLAYTDAERLGALLHLVFALATDTELKPFLEIMVKNPKFLELFKRIALLHSALPFLEDPRRTSKYVSFKCLNYFSTIHSADWRMLDRFRTLVPTLFERYLSGDFIRTAIKSSTPPPQHAGKTEKDYYHRFSQSNEVSVKLDATLALQQAISILKYSPCDSQQYLGQAFQWLGKTKVDSETLKRIFPLSNTLQAAFYYFLLGHPEYVTTPSVMDEIARKSNVLAISEEILAEQYLPVALEYIARRKTTIDGHILGKLALKHKSAIKGCILEYGLMQRLHAATIVGDTLGCSSENTFSDKAASALQLQQQLLTDMFDLLASTPPQTLLEDVTARRYYDELVRLASSGETLTDVEILIESFPEESKSYIDWVALSASKGVAAMQAILKTWLSSPESELILANPELMAFASKVPETALDVQAQLLSEMTRFLKTTSLEQLQTEDTAKRYHDALLILTSKGNVLSEVNALIQAFPEETQSYIDWVVVSASKGITTMRAILQSWLSSPLDPENSVLLEDPRVIAFVIKESETPTETLAMALSSKKARNSIIEYLSEHHPNLLETLLCSPGNTILLTDPRVLAFVKQTEKAKTIFEHGLKFETSRDSITGYLLEHDPALFASLISLVNEATAFTEENIPFYAKSLTHYLKNNPQAIPQTILQGLSPEQKMKIIRYSVYGASPGLPATTKAERANEDRFIASILSGQINLIKTKSLTDISKYHMQQEPLIQTLLLDKKLSLEQYSTLNAQQIALLKTNCLQDYINTQSDLSKLITKTQDLTKAAYIKLTQEIRARKRHYPNNYPAEVGTLLDYYHRHGADSLDLFLYYAAGDLNDKHLEAYHQNHDFNFAVRTFLENIALYKAFTGCSNSSSILDRLMDFRTNLMLAKAIHTFQKQERDPKESAQEWNQHRLKFALVCSHPLIAHHLRKGTFTFEALYEKYSFRFSPWGAAHLSVLDHQGVTALLPKLEKPLNFLDLFYEWMPLEITDKQRTTMLDGFFASITLVEKHFPQQLPTLIDKHGRTQYDTLPLYALEAMGHLEDIGNNPFYQEPLFKACLIALYQNTNKAMPDTLEEFSQQIEALKALKTSGTFKAIEACFVQLAGLQQLKNMDEHYYFKSGAIARAVSTELESLADTITDRILSAGHQKTRQVDLEEKRLALLQTASIKSLNTLANHESINRVRATHKMRFKKILDACLAVISFGLAFTSVHFRCRFMNTRSRERLEMARVNFQRALPKIKAT